MVYDMIHLTAIG